MNVTGYCTLSVLGLILFFTTSGYSIRCWICNSKTEPACADPFDNRTLPLHDCALIDPRPPRNSDLKFTLCGKIVQKSENNETIIHRVCAQEGDNGLCSASQLSIYGKVENCTTCFDKAGCNSV